MTLGMVTSTVMLHFIKLKVLGQCHIQPTKTEPEKHIYSFIFFNLQLEEKSFDFTLILWPLGSILFTVMRKIRTFFTVHGWPSAALPPIIMYPTSMFG